MPSHALPHTAASLALLLVCSLLLASAAQVLVRLADRPQRPLLPSADLPPAGLSRLVPVGRAVEEEVHRGLAALDGWLREQRSH